MLRPLMRRLNDPTSSITNGPAKTWNSVASHGGEVHQPVSCPPHPLLLLSAQRLTRRPIAGPVQLVRSGTGKEVAVT